MINEHSREVQIIKKAQENYNRIEGVIVIGSKVVPSPINDGFWVNAEVWVPYEDENRKT